MNDYNKTLKKQKKKNKTKKKTFSTTKQEQIGKNFPLKQKRKISSDKCYRTKQK